MHDREAAATTIVRGIARDVTGAVPLAVICLLPILLYLPFMASPFERDEGVYATIAQGLLAGEVPYRDLFDNKPPLVYGWYALSFLVFGEHVIAPRLVAAILLSLTAFALFGQTRMLYGRGVAYATTAAFGIATGLPFVALHANTEAYMLLPLVTSLMAFTAGMRNGRLRWLVLAGALGGLAVMTKQVAVWNLAALTLVALLWSWRDYQGWTRLKPAASLLVGAAATVSLVAAPFIATGSAYELLQANVVYNWLYVGVLSTGERLIMLLQGGLFMIAVAAPLVGCAFLGLWTVVRRNRPRVDQLVVLWAVASAIGVASGGRFFPHYFLHLLPALAILAGIVIYKWVGSGRAGIPAAPALLIGLVLVFASGVTNFLLYTVPARTEEQVAPSIYHQKQWETDSRALGGYIAARTEPDDTIFNFGREAQLYFYADRRPAVRYFADWPFWWDRRTLYETIKALREAKPIYVVDSAQEPLFEDYDAYHPPVLMNYLEENYDYVGRVYFADIYRLKGAPVHSPVRD